MAAHSILRRSIVVATLTFVALAGVNRYRAHAAQRVTLVRGNAPGEWRYWGADAWSTRYSPLDQINAANFNSLHIAWQWKAGDFGADEYYRTTPLYADGRILTVATTHRDAFAIDPVTGKTIWQWINPEGIRYQKAPRMFAGRGLAYWTDNREERAIVITPGYHLVSIDAKTGKLDPQFGHNGIVDLEEGLGYPLVPLAVDDTGGLQISEANPARRARAGESWNAATRTGADGSVGIDPANGEIASSSPAIVVGDVIVVGNSAIHGYFPLHLHNIPGFIRGFDVHTGKLLWKFDLIPQPGEFGATTWTRGSKIGTPGVGKNDAWAPYSADPDLGLVYIGVGEGLNDDYGGHRPGANLFANSIVALDAKTGVRKWHFQLVHHDIWDYDVPMAPNLLDVTINGQRRKIIAATTKQGWVYVLDRVTGRPVWPMPETAVEQSEVPGEQTWPTQPIPSKPAPYAQQGLLASDLIDYTPAIKDSALKLAERCRMGPYFIPPSPADARGAKGPAKYTCSWYAPGAAGGVNIDGGTAADPETGMIYVGGQSGLQPLSIQKDPCSEHAYSEMHNSCGLPGALPPPAGYVATDAVPTRGGRGGGGRGGAPAIGGVSIVKPKQLGGVTAYNLNTGDKAWWIPNGGQMRPVTSTDPMFAGITLPPVPAGNGQPEVITTRTLVIYGTGRSGGGPNATPELYAVDKATGKQVGAVQIPSKTSAVPMTFMHQGKQYIVFATGVGSNTSLVALTLSQ
ncbi:MAG TPA: PQQ-binding-like beta-propeller repeat protein [Gemmatimonadales bacterium]|jgi:quinoprotein glucose dehydrogenase